MVFLLVLLAGFCVSAWLAHAAYSRQWGAVSMIIFAVGSLWAFGLISRVLDWSGVSRDPTDSPDLKQAALRRIVIALLGGGAILGMNFFLAHEKPGLLNLTLGLLIGGCFFMMMKALADLLLASRR